MIPEAKIIYVLNGEVKLAQAPNGFQTGLDAVMLAAACPVKNAQSVLDLGCGVGSAGLCVLHRVPGAKLTGVDIQNDHIELAAQNAALNKMQDDAGFVHADIRTWKPARAGHVICNPPYMEDGAHMKSPSAARARAMGHEDTTLEDWVSCAFEAISGRGSLTMIHRADMTDRILQALGKRFGATDIIPLWPRAGKPAGRVIIRTWKHKKNPAVLHPGLVLHEENGDYTGAAENILRKGCILQ